MVNRAQALRFYIRLLGVLTLAVVGMAAVGIWHLPHSLLAGYALTGAIFAVLCWTASRRQLYNRNSSTIGMGTTPQVAALIVLPFPLAIMAIAVGKFLSELSIRLQGRRPWRAVVVNLGGAVFANVAAGAAFHMLLGDHFIWLRDYGTLLALPALAGLAVSYHVVDALVVVGAINLSGGRGAGESPWSVFRGLFTGVLLPHVSLVFVGALFAVLWHYSPVLSLLIIVPVAFSAQSFEAVARLRKETIEAVLKLAESIDYRDTGTSEHSQRLTSLTRKLATSLGLTPETVNEIVLAARVHDLGKVGISNDILFKPGVLTDEEFKAMQEHPAIGANILSSYSAFQGSVPIVRHHHERWDGRGYPDALKGEEIPLGSRIITVVDSFDAMTSDRPYRQGISAMAAVERLKDGMGTQFDPRICASFIQLLIEEGTYTPPDSGAHLHLVSDRAG